MLDPFGEVTDLCEYARRVNQLCELLGYEFRGFKPLMTYLGEHADADYEIRDGSFILPDEGDADA